MFYFKCKCGQEFPGSKSNQRTKHLKSHGHFLEFKCLHCDYTVHSKKVYELVSHIKDSHFDAEHAVEAVIRSISSGVVQYTTVATKPAMDQTKRHA